MRKFVLQNLWWMTLLLGLALLIVHSLPGQVITVDSTSVILLLIIFLSPFMSAIRKVKFGEFEAEIDPKQIKRIKDEVETQLPAAPPETVPDSEIESTVMDIKKLAESDVVISLAKLRIEIEKVISRLFRQTQRNRQSQSGASLGKMVHQLDRQELLPPNISGPIREVISICNRAVHGEEIRESDAKVILDIGMSLLQQLFWLSKEYILKPIESEVITTEQVEDYRHARFRLTTVIPYVDKPVRNVLIVDQAALDDFLEGYQDYGEFIVEITKVADDATPRDQVD